MTEIGEYLVGAYLKVIENCDFVDYNARPPGGGVKGLEEFDVVGFDFKNDVVFLCEVTTHIRGVLYGGGTEDTINRIKGKYERQQLYYKANLKDNFKGVHYMFWSPVVPDGKITAELAKLVGLESVINKEYSRRVAVLRKKASELTNDVVNPAFRLLQILSHLKS